METMPQEVYSICDFDRKKMHNKLAKAIERGKAFGDMSEDQLVITKGVLTLSIKVNGTYVSFQISPFGKLIISHPDNYKLRKAKSKLKKLIGGKWVPKEPPEREIPYEAKRSHLEQLKRELIKPWLEELPLVSDFDVSVRNVHAIDIAGFGFLPYKGEELVVEKHPLFSDLRVHFPEVFESWGRFKKETKRFWGMREKLTDEIEDMLKKKLRVEGVHDGRGELKCGFMTPKLIEMVLKVAYALPSERGHKLLADFFVEGLKFEKGLFSAVGIQILRVDLEDTETTERMKQDMNRTVKMVRKKYSSELESLRSSLSTLEGYRKEIVQLLERYLFMQDLSGYCDLILPPQTV